MNVPAINPHHIGLSFLAYVALLPLPATGRPLSGRFRCDARPCLLYLIPG